MLASIFPIDMLKLWYSSIFAAANENSEVNKANSAIQYYLKEASQ